jgi:hypothetical protein
MAGNYDITDIFGDATFKILCGKDAKDFEALADFVQRIDSLTGNSDAVVSLTVSCDPTDLPERVQQYII